MIFQYAFALLLVLTTGVNTVSAFKLAPPFRRHLEDVQADARSGIPPMALAQRYWESLIRRHPANLARRFKQLHEAGLPPYQRSRSGGELRNVIVTPAANLQLPSESRRPPRARVAGRFTLRPGGEYRFRIRSLKKALPLIRVDLKIFPDHRTERNAAELEWRIECNPADGKSEIVAEGSPASSHFKWDGFVTLDIPEVIIDGRADFFFILKNSGGENLEPIRIPLYRPASSGNSAGSVRMKSIANQGLCPKCFLFYEERSGFIVRLFDRVSAIIS